ncbi:hypothetical protein JZ751_013408, partial [Albula glossodonta]
MPMMKASKPPASTQEECGVWLDTADLRRKCKVARPFRPIARVLNPLVPNRGYSAAVALNFTQTKLQFPTTTQSSITAFLQPPRQGKEESGSKVTAVCSPAPATLERKRKRSGDPANHSEGDRMPANRREGGGVSVNKRVGSGSPANQKKRGVISANQTEGGKVSANQRQKGGDSQERPLGGAVRELSWQPEEKGDEEERAGKRLCAPDSSLRLRFHFTQDSQGQRVIAHQGEGKENHQTAPPLARPLAPPTPLSPLAISHNRGTIPLSPWKRTPHDLWEVESQVESLTQLFTQDSEGRLTHIVVSLWKQYVHLRALGTDDLTVEGLLA